MFCPANACMSDPRQRGEHGLHGGSALSSMPVPSRRWALATRDQENAFTRVRVPDCMSKWQAAPPLRAYAVWDVFPLSLRRRIRPFDWVAATYHRLATGGSHSVHLLMSINGAAIGQAIWSSATVAPRQVEGAREPADEEEATALQEAEETAEEPPRRLDEDWAEQSRSRGGRRS